MQRRNTMSGLMVALVAGLSVAAGSPAFAQGEPVAPPARADAAPEGRPVGEGREGRAPEGEAISDKELAERLRGRAEDVERLARTLRDAAAKVEDGGGRLEAFRMIEEAQRPLRGDWLERLGARRMGDRARDERMGDGRMGDGRREGSPGAERDGRGPDGRGPDGRAGEGRNPEDRGHEGRGPDGDRTLTDAERESMMQFAREHLPRMAARIDQLRQTDPALADRVMLRLAPRVREVLATRDATLAALRLEELQAGAVVLDQVRILREAMKNDDAAATESAKSELKTALEAQFDAKIKLQQHEVTMLTNRIESLRGEIENRVAGKDEFIARLLERMSSNEPRGLPGEVTEGIRDGRGQEGRRGPRGDGAGRPRNEPAQP